MSKPVAKGGDRVIGLDTHIVLLPSPGGPTRTSVALPFNGPLSEGLSETVFIEDQGAAVVGSVAVNTPRHFPLGGPFQSPPSNRATVSNGSETIFVDDAALARASDPATCCNDPVDQDTGHVVVTG